MMRRLIDWRPGDVVRLTAPQWQHARPDRPLPEGSIGHLGGVVSDPRRGGVLGVLAGRQDARDRACRGGALSRAGPVALVLLV